MHPKVADLINSISSDYSNDCKELEDNRSAVKIGTTELSHFTYLSFELSSDVLRVEMNTCAALSTARITVRFKTYLSY